MSTPVYDQIVALEREAVEMGTRYRGMATWSVLDQLRIRAIWTELAGLWSQRREEIVAARVARSAVVEAAARAKKTVDIGRVNGYGKYRSR